MNKLLNQKNLKGKPIFSGLAIFCIKSDTVAHFKKNYHDKSLLHGLGEKVDHRSVISLDFMQMVWFSTAVTCKFQGFFSFVLIFKWISKYILSTPIPVLILISQRWLLLYFHLKNTATLARSLLFIRFYRRCALDKHVT